MAKSKDKTLLQKMQEICPYHIAKYVQWYLSDQKKMQMGRTVPM